MPTWYIVVERAVEKSKTILGRHRAAHFPTADADAGAGQVDCEITYTHRHPTQCVVDFTPL